MKKQRGNLIIYDNNGKIWFESGEAEGEILPHVLPEGLPYIELKFGAFKGKNILSVDVSDPKNHQLVTEDIIVEKTVEQLRIEELETQLLLNEGVI
jgi:hypothetical protein